MGDGDFELKELIRRHLNVAFTIDDASDEQPNLEREIPSFISTLNYKNIGSENLFNAYLFAL